MEKNMGTTDRIVRLVLAAIAVLLIASDTVTGMAAYIVGALALVFAATSSVSVCPLYLPLKLSSRKKPA